MFQGGEFQNGLPVRLTYDATGLFWTGTLLGSAAQRDVGAGSGDVPVVQTVGGLLTAVIAPGRHHASGAHSHRGRAGPRVAG